MIPKELRKLKRWVCCSSDSKIPMQATCLKAAASNNPDTWSEYEVAAEAVANGIYSYLGFVFSEQDGYVGIDIDAGRNELGLLNELSLDVIRHCKSYTESSKSGRGVHVYLKGKLPFKGRNNRDGIEIYSTGRYFIVTGRQIAYKNIIENQNAIDYILDKYFKEEIKESTNNVKSTSFYQPYFERRNNGKIMIKPIYPKIRTGCRNDSLASLAGQLHAKGYTYDEIYKELIRCNETACKPPLDNRELELIAKSITRYSR